MDKAIREGSLLRLRQTYMDWLVEGGLKYGALKGLEKLAASAGADLTNFALFEDATFGVGSLVILGATLMDAYCLCLTITRREILRHPSFLSNETARGIRIC